MASGRSYALISLMNLLLAGLLSGRKYLSQIVLRARTFFPKTFLSIGFSKDVSCVATLSNLSRPIDPEKLDHVLIPYTLKGQCLLEPNAK